MTEKIEVCFESGEKNCWEKRKCWIPSFLPLEHIQDLLASKSKLCSKVFFAVILKCCLSLCVEPPEKPVGPIQFSDLKEDSVKLSWKPPTDDGGQPITGYNIEFREKSRSTWQKAGSVDKDTTSWTQSKLLEDNDYLFRVTAVNAKGESAPLEASELVRPKKPLGRCFVH